MTGAISINSCLSSQAGFGSSGHDFDGTILIKVKISPSMTGSYKDTDDMSLSMITGGGAVVVANLIFCTLLLKKSAKTFDIRVFHTCTTIQIVYLMMMMTLERVTKTWPMCIAWEQHMMALSAAC